MDASEIIGTLSKFDRLPPKGTVYRYRKLLFWAQGGCICIEDEAMDGDFQVVSRAEFAARVITMRANLEKGRYKYPDERIEDENFVINGAKAVKEGKHQGDPFDPEVLQQKMFELRQGRILLGNGSGAVVGAHYYRRGAVSQSQDLAAQAVLPPLPVKDRPNEESMRQDPKSQTRTRVKQ